MVHLSISYLNLHTWLLTLTYLFVCAISRYYIIAYSGSDLRGALNNKSELCKMKPRVTPTPAESADGSQPQQQSATRAKSATLKTSAKCKSGQQRNETLRVARRSWIRRSMKRRLCSPTRR